MKTFITSLFAVVALANVAPAQDAKNHIERLWKANTQYFVQTPTKSRGAATHNRIHDRKLDIVGDRGERPSHLERRWNANGQSVLIYVPNR